MANHKVSRCVGNTAMLTITFSNTLFPFTSAQNPFHLSRAYHNSDAICITVTTQACCRSSVARVDLICVSGYYFADSMMPSKAMRPNVCAPIVVSRKALRVVCLMPRTRLRPRIRQLANADLENLLPETRLQAPLSDTDVASVRSTSHPGVKMLGTWHACFRRNQGHETSHSALIAAVF